MRISFDPAKWGGNAAHSWARFADVAVVFEGPIFTFPDERYDYPEERYVTAGMLADRMVIVVWTPAPDGRRIISMRKGK